MESLSFDSMATLYDETRVVDQKSIDGALQFLLEGFPARRFQRLLEPGVGTGRIAIPLAEKGYQVTGVDVSILMLRVLHEQLHEPGRDMLPIDYELGDAASLPFADAVFDLAVAVHLFYWIRNWQKAAEEISRVVRPGGALILMHTGTGTEVPFLNDRYRRLCADRGCPVAQVGVSSTSEVVDYFRKRGQTVESVRGRWMWTARVRLDRTLEQMRQRAFSFTASVPQEDHLEVMHELESEVRTRFGRVKTEVYVPNEVYMEIVQL